MTTSETRCDKTERVSIAGCEVACRELGDACAGALQSAITRGGAPERGAELLMDCWHVASATARLLGRYADYDPTNTAMQVSVCWHVASRAVTSCDQVPGPLHDLGVAAGRCAAACTIVLEVIWDRAVDPVASWDDRNAPVEVILEQLATFDDDDQDEPTCHLGPSHPARRRATRAGIAPIRAPARAH